MRRASFAAVVSVILFALVLNASADRVFIGFAKQPGAAEKALVRGVGGKIKHTYRIIPAIAADLPARAIAQLRNNPMVTRISPDHRAQALDTELDNSWGAKRIGAGIVHDSGNKGAGVNIAILDTGIDYTHPDLDANVAGGISFVENITDYMDDHGHGTYVAGIVAAEDNDVPDSVVGVAPEASLYAVKVLDSTGSGWFSDIIMGIQWCTEKKIHITNMSFGADMGDIWLEAACLLAYEQDGLLLVAAAGNEGNPRGTGDSVGYPAKYPYVIAVAATDQFDERAPWSSTGPQVELSAPGVNVNSTFLGGGYEPHGGTSAATPHVVGTGALVWAANPTWTNVQVRAKLQSTADDLGKKGWDPKYGYGLVDADEAAEVIPGATTVSVTSIDYKTTRGGRDLLITPSLLNDLGDPVAGASVSIDVYLNFSYYGSGTGTTGADGKVTFKARNAPPGFYTTYVTAVLAKDLTWDGVTPDNGYNKEKGGGLKGKPTALMQNSPNPFNPETWIPYRLAEEADVIIRIYDAAGRLVRKLDLGQKTPGAYVSKENAAYWDGTNENGEKVSSGIYFYAMEAGSFRAMKKMIAAK